MKPLISLHGRRFDRWGARLLLLASFASTSVLSLPAQEPVSWWKPAAAPPGAASWGEPPAGRYYQLDRSAAWSVLQRAPLE
jgi:hypothetical protein